MNIIKMTQKLPIYEAVMYTGDNIDDIEIFSNRDITKCEKGIKISGQHECIVHIGEYVLKAPNKTIFSCTENTLREYYNIH